MTRAQYVHRRIRNLQKAAVLGLSPPNAAPVKPSKEKGDPPEGLFRNTSSEAPTNQRSDHPSMKVSKGPDIPAAPAVFNNVDLSTLSWHS